jgi:PEGA domain-containing protein
MSDDELDRQIAHAIAARRLPPARDFEARLAAAVARPRASWLVPALASLVAAGALVVLLWRVPHRAPEPPPPAPVPIVAPPPAGSAPDASGTLSIECEPPARVLLDAREVGTTPIELRVAPGEHRLDLVGAQHVVRRLEIKPGEHQRIVLKIE